MFQRLPTEIIALVMCHTWSGDLVNLIQTEKSMNEIFQNHKRFIFKRMQICQFPEFSGWFGDLPGFDGSILANKRTSEQVQRLKDVVFTFDWRHVVAAPSDDGNAEVFLHLLEKYGGWRYLYFLYSIKYDVECETQNLYRGTHMAIPSMNEGLAKATVLCLSKMSWRAATVVGGEVEELADMPARVESRLRSFQREPPAVQELITRTLSVIIYCIASRLQLAGIMRGYRHRYVLAGLGNPTLVHTDYEFCLLTWETMTKLLLECFFFYGLGTSMQLCDDPMNDEARLAQSWIKQRFEQELVYAITSGTFDAVLYDDPCIQEGSLWAAGIGFRAFD